METPSFISNKPRLTVAHEIARALQAKRKRAMPEGLALLSLHGPNAAVVYPSRQAISDAGAAVEIAMRSVYAPLVNVAHVYADAAGTYRGVESVEGRFRPINGRRLEWVSGAVPARLGAIARSMIDHGASPVALMDDGDLAVHDAAVWHVRTTGRTSITAATIVAAWASRLGRCGPAPAWAVSTAQSWMLTRQDVGAEVREACSALAATDLRLKLRAERRRSWRNGPTGRLATLSDRARYFPMLPQAAHARAKNGGKGGMRVPARHAK